MEYTGYDDFIIELKTDLKGTITYVSQALINISGYTKEELIGQNANILRDPSIDSKLFTSIWKKLEDNKTTVFELSNKTKKGDIYWVKIKIFPIFKKNIKVGYGSLQIEITSNKTLELLKDRIESDYHSSISNNQMLIDSLKELNNQNIQKDKEHQLFKTDMVTIFTHELKTPLNSILSYSDYIYRNLSKPLTPKKIDKMINLASRINQNGLTQLNMVENILESSRATANKKKLFKEKLNLKHIILSTVDKYGTAYDKKVEFDLDDIEHSVNSKNFTIIFDNMYSNALKYSKSEVKITLKAIENGYDLSIEDDGDGIKEENREKVFHLFEQADTEVLQREKIGTGVGLYTAKLLAGKCGCDITIEDSSMGGAKFILCGTNA